MSFDNLTDVLNALLNCTTGDQITKILEKLGDSAEISVDQPFGPFAFSWHFYGDKDSNVSSVNLGTKPGRSMTERVTNGIDGVLERRMKKGAELPLSPMDSAKTWFGRPPSTADNGLFRWKDYPVNDIDKMVRLVLLPGDKATSPTIDVIDQGIGIRPNEFPISILSLQRGNKIKKRYLAGSYGQGGSATLAFSKFALIVSRHFEDPKRVGFTIVKLMKMDEDEGYKEDAYVYLSSGLKEGFYVVPEIDFQLDSLDVYPFLQEKEKPSRLTSGTLVRHFGYDLGGLDKTLTSSSGNLYHSSQYLMFDPILPFRILDRRKEGSFKDELITGSRNRLMKYTILKEDSEESSEGGRTELRHHMPREMVSLRSDESPLVGIEYWVIFNRRKVKDKQQLRGYSNELFIDKNHPIIATMNGQNQGEMPPGIFREIDLPMVARHIIVHVDATLASSETRRNLFSTTREGFKDGQILDEMTRIIKDMLSKDEVLYEIEKELQETMLKKATAETDVEVNKEIVDLLKNAGYVGKKPGEVLVTDPSGTEQVNAPPKIGKKPKKPTEPLPTLPYPQVTKFKIVYPTEKFLLPIKDFQSIRIETDADFKFDREQHIGIRFDPDKLEVATKSLLRGGRMHWRVRAKTDATPGETGMVIASITKPDGLQLNDTVEYEIAPPRQDKAKKDKILLPDFKLIPVDPDTEADEFSNVWPDLESDERYSVAYRVVPSKDVVNVYYSTGFKPFRAQLGELKTQPTLAGLFEKNYKIWIGFHAIIQNQESPELKSQLELHIDDLDMLQERERAMVAEMQVKQALKVAELQQQLLKQKVGE